jgi:DNA-binding protein HU-beta
MNKGELVKKVASRIGVTEKQVNPILSALIEVIAETVAEGERVSLVGFGVFESRDRQARECRNPKSGELLTVPATTIPVLSPGKTFKDAVKQGAEGEDLETEEAA